MRFRVGASGPLLIRDERVHLGLPEPRRLLYASDLHLGHRWTAGIPEQLLAAVKASTPDLILLGGDLTDRAAALPQLGETIRALKDVAPVAAVPGNHDERAGVAATCEVVMSAGGRWLPDDPTAGSLPIDGRIRSGCDGPRILCAHDPADFPTAVAAGYRLVFAGHLHGGQCVLWNRRGRQYPAAWLNRWHGLRFEAGKAVMLVSRGAADTFPFRFHCPREVIVCVVT